MARKVAPQDQGSGTGRPEDTGKKLAGDRAGRKVKKHGRTPSGIRTRVRYEHEDGPEQDRAFDILAQLLADCSRRVPTENGESMELNDGVIRTSSRGHLP